MSFQLIEEAAAAGANWVLGNQYTDHDILDLVNDICDTSFTVEDAIGKVIIVTYTSAAVHFDRYRGEEGSVEKAEKYGIAQAEKHPYYRDLEEYYADVEPIY